MRNTKIDQKVRDKKRCEKAKLPLKKFNDEIFVNIAFSGVVIEKSYSRQERGYEPRGSF